MELAADSSLMVEMVVLMVSDSLSSSGLMVS